MNQKLDEATKSKIVEMYQAGHKVDYIAAECKLHKSTVNRIVRESGIPRRNRIEASTPGQTDEQQVDNTATKEPQQDFMGRIIDFIPIVERLLGNKGSFSIILTEDDLLVLTPEEFNNVWNAIGTCLYNRRKKEGEVCQQSKSNQQ